MFLGKCHLEMHALVCVLTVMHEEIDLPEALKQGRQDLLTAADQKLPPGTKLIRHEPAGVLADRDDSDSARYGLGLPLSRFGWVRKLGQVHAVQMTEPVRVERLENDR